MRVAFVTGTVEMGGTTSFLFNLSSQFVQRSLAVKILSFQTGNPLEADFQKAGVRVLCLDHHRHIYEDRLQTVLSELSHFEPTVVIANLGQESFEVLRYMPRGVFRVAAAQSDDPDVYTSLRTYAKFLDLLVAVSQTIEKRFRNEQQFFAVPIKCLHYGVPMPVDSEPLSADPTRPLRILYLGRLEREQKRVHLFPQILERLKSSGIPFHWTIVGKGSHGAILQREMVATNAVQTVEFFGDATYSEVPGILKQHDVLLLASDYEGLPLSLLEAMGHGLVPVVSNLPSGIPEVVDQSNGVLIPPDNITAYADAIIRLHRHREELASKSMAARQRVRTHYSVQAMADRWLNALPKEPNHPIVWPERWKVKPILVDSFPIRYSPPMRVLRRWLKTLRG